MADDDFLWRQLEHRCARSVFLILWVTVRNGEEGEEGAAGEGVEGT